MRARWILFAVLSGGHFTVALVAPRALAPAIAGSVYVPLMLFKSAGVPVFSAAEPGGWSAPSWLGWVIVLIVWLAIWWAVASLLSHILSRLNRDA